MSVHPTRLVRAGLLAVAASIFVMPSSALADHKDDHRGKPESPGKSLEAHDKDKKDKKDKGEKGKPESPGKSDEDHGKKLGHNEKGDGPRSETENQAPVAAQAPSTVAPQTVVLPPCTSSRYFKITVGKRKNIRRARVLLNGKTVSVSYGKRKVKARIDLRGRVKGTYMVTTVVVTKKNRIKTRTRTYKVCGG